ncbi:hypothetical protein OCU04_001086 [Sclerotinia nivalis]|uniref:Uncharacterized protein n=1 Tax=Sclerotinia nivalis TaxID=352851 RepID=A0A9X0AXE4_9HELO|nr:hypothetical protein OCU04_001086 [Sclerotinia nivalis]
MADISQCHVCEKMYRDRMARYGCASSRSGPGSTVASTVTSRITLSNSTAHLEECILCLRPFCPQHKEREVKEVCEINHDTYYRRHPDIVGIFPSMVELERAPEQEKKREKRAQEQKIRDLETKEDVKVKQGDVNSEATGNEVSFFSH